MPKRSSSLSGEFASSFGNGARHGVAAGVTVAALLLVLLGITAIQGKWDWHAVTQNVLQPPAQQAPDDAIYKMLDAAKAGDVEAYLACFTGSMRTQIEQVIKETSRANFAQYLRNQNGRFTSVAVTVKDNADGQSARVRVEYVFRERNEVQDFHLRRDGRNWQIVKVVGSEQITTLIPFGTAVTD